MDGVLGSPGIGKDDSNLSTGHGGGHHGLHVGIRGTIDLRLNLQELISRLHGCRHAGTHTVKTDASGLVEALNDPPEHILL